MSGRTGRGAGEGYRLQRRDRDGRVTDCGTLAELLGGWKGRDERWLFIAPHDDDVIMGAGLLLQCAVAEGAAVSVLITTDGSMGYCTAEDRPTIREIRRRETTASFAEIGVEDVSWLGFPDCNLTPYLGRRPAAKRETRAIAGHIGLQNSYTYALRRRRPTRLFLASANDLHPDHKLVHQEARVSVFHAGGAIWPELGEPLAELPVVYELAIYCDLSVDPEYRVAGTAAQLEAKLAGITAYRSQKQIDRLVENLRKAGPVEYFGRSDFKLYSPSVYDRLFAAIN